MNRIDLIKTARMAKKNVNETIQMFSEVSVRLVKEIVPVKWKLRRKRVQQVFFFFIVRPYCFFALSVRISSVLNRSHRDTAVLCAFS